jgi:dienelactone hydrolase
MTYKLRIKALAFLSIFFVVPIDAMAREDCNPPPKDVAQLVEIRPGFHKVTGPLAHFDPCHASVHFSMPGIFSRKLGELPPLMIIAHGGNGPGGAEMEMMRRMNREGVAALLYDAYAMNGFQYKGTPLFLLGVTNESRQRMIFKATYGAYQWAINQPAIDASRIYINGLSNGGSVAVNMAGAVDPKHVPAVIAEGASPTGIGFPDETHVPLKLVYGRLDNYGGKAEDDWMFTRSDPCSFNFVFEMAPVGVSARCSARNNPQDMVPSPLVWMGALQAQGRPIEMWFYEKTAHGILNGPMKKETRTYGTGTTANLRYGWTGSDYDVPDKYIADIVKLIKSSYP